MNLRRPLRAVASLWLAGLAACTTSAPQQEAVDSWPAQDRALIAKGIAALAPQRPGQPDLYVLGVAGDGHEDVFRNEVAYLSLLMQQRFDARGRTFSLVNHADSFGAARAPLATVANLREALSGLGRVMDRDEDILLLFMTSHGTEDHAFVLQLFPVIDGAIRPHDVREALDAAGIRHRVVVVSACYSGGFVPALRGPDALVITAARSDRTSFGCGEDAKATYFGRAWMIEGLNATTDFVSAYTLAAGRIARRERADDYAPSLPQIAIGANIGARLRAWRDTFTPGSPVPYPYREVPPSIEQKQNKAKD